MNRHAAKRPPAKFRIVRAEAFSVAKQPGTPGGASRSMDSIKSISMLRAHASGPDWTMMMQGGSAKDRTSALQDYRDRLQARRR